MKKERLKVNDGAQGGSKYLSYYFTLKLTIRNFREMFKEKTLR